MSRLSRGGGGRFFLPPRCCLCQHFDEVFFTCLGGAQIEDVPDGSGRFFIRDELLAVGVFLLAAVGRSAAQPLTALRLYPLDGVHLAAGGIGMEFVGPVLDGIEVVAVLHQGVHATADPDEVHSLLRKVNFRVLTYLEILTSQAAELLDDPCLCRSVRDHLRDLLPGGPVEAGAGVSAISQKPGVLKAIVSRVSLEKELSGVTV